MPSVGKNCFALIEYLMVTVMQKAYSILKGYSFCRTEYIMKRREERCQERDI